jgi:hypothetical protein
MGNVEQVEATADEREVWDFRERERYIVISDVSSFLSPRRLTVHFPGRPTKQSLRRVILSVLTKRGCEKSM